MNRNTASKSFRFFVFLAGGGIGCLVIHCESVRMNVS